MDVARDGGQLATGAVIKCQGAEVLDHHCGSRGNINARHRLVYIQHGYSQLAGNDFGEHVHAGVVVHRDGGARGKCDKAYGDGWVIQDLEKLNGR